MTGWENIIGRIETQHRDPHGLQPEIGAGVGVIIVNRSVSEHDWGEPFIKLSDGFCLKNKTNCLFLESKEEIKGNARSLFLPSWHDPYQSVLQTYAGV